MNKKYHFSYFILSIFLLAIFSPLNLWAATGKWYVNYEEALSVARAEGKYVLADFTGSDWCGWCMKLKKEVFNTTTFKSWARDNVVLLEVDYPRASPQSSAIKEQNAKLAKKYNIQGYPTILFLKPSGRSVAKMGYMSGGAQKWIDKANKMLGHQPKLRSKNKKSGSGAIPQNKVEAIKEGIGSKWQALKSKFLNSEKKKPHAPYHLTGIILTQDGPRALIDGELLKEGDTFKDAKIIRVKDTSVVISINGNEKTLLLSEK